MRCVPSIASWALMECLKVSEIMIVTWAKSLSDDQIISSVGRHHGCISYSDGLGPNALKIADQLLASDESLLSADIWKLLNTIIASIDHNVRQIKSHESESALGTHANSRT